MPSKRSYLATALTLLCLTTAPLLGDALLPEPARDAPAPPVHLYSSASTVDGTHTSEHGKPVIIASGEGVLVRETNLPGHSQSTNLRTDEDGWIVVPPHQVAHFRVNLTVSPAAPVRFTISPEWDPHEGQRYAPASLNFFANSRSVEEEWETATCLLPEGTFHVQLAGPFKETHWSDPPRPVVTYAWEGEGHLEYVGMEHDPGDAGVRCVR